MRPAAYSSASRTSITLTGEPCSTNRFTSSTETSRICFFVLDRSSRKVGAGICGHLSALTYNSAPGEFQFARSAHRHEPVPRYALLLALEPLCAPQLRLLKGDPILLGFEQQRRNPDLFAGDRERHEGEHCAGGESAAAFERVLGRDDHPHLHRGVKRRQNPRPEVDDPADANGSMEVQVIHRRRYHHLAAVPLSCDASADVNPFHHLAAKRCV